LKDRKINKEARKLIEFIEGRELVTLNGRIRRVEKVEFTYTGGRGKTVLDYLITDREMKDKIIKMEVVERVDSDHHPVVWIRGKVRRKEGRKERIDRREEVCGMIREEKIYKEGRIEKKENIQDEIKRISKRIKQTLKKYEGKTGEWE